MELRDKVVVVTGGASGIGTGLCRRFREEGVRGLVIADLNGEAAAELAAELDGTSYALDVRDESAIAAMVAETEAEFGHLIGNWHGCWRSLNQISTVGLEQLNRPVDKNWGTRYWRQGSRQRLDLLRQLGY